MADQAGASSCELLLELVEDLIAGQHVGHAGVRVLLGTSLRVEQFGA